MDSLSIISPIHPHPIFPSHTILIFIMIVIIIVPNAIAELAPAAWNMRNTKSAGKLGALARPAQMPTYKISVLMYTGRRPQISASDPQNEGVNA